MLRICPKCQHHVEPRERFEKDKKGKTWKISYCSYDRCKFNFDLEESHVKLWNHESCSFEDYIS